MKKVYKLYTGLNSVSKYDPKTALSLAVACQLAYEKASIIKSTAKDWGYKETSFIDVKKGKDIDFQGFVTYDEDNIVVAIRGSDSPADWFANFQAVTDPGPLKKTKAHEGFQDSLYPAVIKLTTILNKYQNNNQNIWITGHSLGGALCSLYAGMLIENGYTIFGIYTFASPRPGNSKFAEQLNSKVIGPHHRIINSGDVVPHVPPEPLFSHPGNRKILKWNKSDSREKSWWDERIAALKKFVAMTGNALDVVDNHRLNSDDESYIPRLLREVKR